jgi:hypothetical protein
MIVATFTTRDGVDGLLAIAGMGPAEQLEHQGGRGRRGRIANGTES